jgi:hypothetical protein
MVPGLQTDASIEKLVLSADLDAGDVAEYNRRREEARQLRGGAPRTAIVLKPPAAAAAAGKCYPDVGCAMCLVLLYRVRDWLAVVATISVHTVTPCSSYVRISVPDTASTAHSAY